MVSPSKPKKRGHKKVSNPFKDEHPGCAHWALLFAVALLVTTGFVALTEQGKDDAQRFHQKHIAKHLHRHRDKKGQEEAKTREKMNSLLEAHKDPRDPQRLEELKRQVAEKRLDVKNDEEDEENEDFPDLDLDEFSDWLHTYRQNLKWHKLNSNKGYEKKLNKSILSNSLTLGCLNMVHNQREEGNFNYLFDFVHSEVVEAEDSQVRQAGALWGLTLCFQTFPENLAIREAVDKGINFFLTHTEEGPVDGSLAIHYPDEDQSDLGTSALFGLSLVDYIRTVRDNPGSLSGVSETWMETLEKALEGIIEYLVEMQEDHGNFKSWYNFESEQKNPSATPSPYYDGEAFLCLIKAAKFLPNEYESMLLSRIEDKLPFVLKLYTLEAWRHKTHDSDLTKGFYQWSSMALTEIFTMKPWDELHNLASDYVIALAHWIIHTHKILGRTRNTGYAFEGLVAAYQVAKASGLKDVMRVLEVTIDTGLHKLSTWQVGGPLAHANPFLEEHPTKDERAVGGVMNGKDETKLRIDTTQHQMHALMMALDSGVYSASAALNQ